MLKEFKEFALKGNVMDLAVGVIIGAAFQSIITSLVEDIIMPLINSVTGKVDFSDLTFTLGQSQIRYGTFITAVVNFLIVAFSIFLVVRYINKLNTKLEKMKQEELDRLVREGKIKRRETDKEEAPTTKVCPFCYTEININATRCPHCTSELHEDVEESAE